MVYIHKTHAPNSQRKITLEKVSYYENKWYPPIHHFTSPSLFIGKIWMNPPPPFFFKNFENLPPPSPPSPTFPIKQMILIESVMVYIHKTHTPNNQIKITLEKVSYCENKWYYHIHHFTSPSLFIEKIWMNPPPPPHLSFLKISKTHPPPSPAFPIKQMILIQIV